MRTHASLGVLILAPTERLRRMVRVDTLTSVRLEPIVRQQKPLAMLELRFSDGDEAAIVPLVLVDVAMLLDPERDVLVWPAHVAEALDEKTAASLAETIVPWTIAQTLGQTLNTERTWQIGGPSERELYTYARSKNAIGAAPAQESFQKAAPFVYAGRFWTGGRIGLAGDAAELGAALASGSGIDFEFARESEPDAALLRWYGVQPQPVAKTRTLVVEPSSAKTHFASGLSDEVVRIGVRTDAAGRIPLVVPSPIDAAFAFDAADGTVKGSLEFSGSLPATLPARRRHLRPTTIGDSGGRIFFGVRSAQLPGNDGDIDEAFALADALRIEGFTVDVGDDPDAVASGGYDLVHVFGTLDAARTLAFLAAAKAVGAATALHAYAEEATLGGWWGTVVTRYCYEYAADQRSVDDFSALLRERRLVLGDVRADRAYAPPGQNTAMLRTAVRAADVVFASGEVERAFINQRYGRSENVVVVPPAIPFSAEGSPVGALIGTVNYAFIHAPIGPRGNQIVAMRAADRAKIPLVVAGTVDDPSYLSLLREFGGASTRILTDPSAEVLESLYAGATVFLDVAWVGTGRAHAARAAVAGARIVIADRRPADPVLDGGDISRVDPGDESGITRALGNAWYASTEFRVEPALCERVHHATVPRSVAAAVAGGYALLTQPRSAPAARV